MSGLSQFRIRELAGEVNSLHPERIIQFADDKLSGILDDRKSAALFWQAYITHKLTKAGLETPPNIPHLSSEQSYSCAIKIHFAAIEARSNPTALQTATKELAAEPIQKGRFTVKQLDQTRPAEAHPHTVRIGRFFVTRPKRPAAPTSGSEDLPRPPSSLRKNL